VSASTLIKVKNIQITPEKIILDTEKGYAFFLIEDSLLLKNASEMQKKHFTISPFGIHWEELDEDLCFDGFEREFSLSDTLRYV
jgi:hypothetical protein